MLERDILDRIVGTLLGRRRTAMCLSVLKRVSFTEFDFGLICSLLELIVKLVIIKIEDDNDDNKTT